MATTEQPITTENPSPIGDFGANEWLVEDMYERFQTDPDSVDPAWHDFFADYRGVPSGNGHPQDESPAAPTDGAGAGPAPAGGDAASDGAKHAAPAPKSAPASAPST